MATSRPVNGEGGSSKTAGPPSRPGSAKRGDLSKVNFKDEGAFSVDERWNLIRNAEYVHGFGNPDLMSIYRFWADNDPAVIKRYGRYVGGLGRGLGAGVAYPTVMAPMMHMFTYACLGYEPGVAYMELTCKQNGCSKAEVLAALSFAFIEAGPMGMHPAARGAERMLWEWNDDAPSTCKWPAEWTPDPSAFASGLDFANDELSTPEVTKLNAWYERVYGEVPPEIHFFEKHHPHALKMYRNRFEKAFGDALPKQMAPVFLLHLSIMRSRPQAIRRAVQMAKAFELNKETVIAVVTLAGLHGWHTAMEPAIEVIGPALDAWDRR